MLLDICKSKLYFFIKKNLEIFPIAIDYVILATYVSKFSDYLCIIYLNALDI